MLKILTKKLRNQSLNEIQPFQLKISYTPSDEEDSDDSEGENQELAQIDRERRRNCTLTPLATNQQQNQENQCCKVRAHFPSGLDHHSSEEELECITREFAAEKRKWSQKMLFKKNCGTKTRIIKIRHINSSRPSPHFVYDPSIFAFQSLSTLKPLSPIAPVEEPSCAY